jgi:hypothetical protein
MTSLSAYCIHTFLHSSVLRRQESGDGSHELTERKAWITGRQLLASAQQHGEQMPLLFSRADIGNGIFYWATIDDITIDPQTRETTCLYRSLRAITPPRTLPELRLRNGNRPVSKDLIRPYAICHTPSFLA